MVLFEDGKVDETCRASGVRTKAESFPMRRDPKELAGAVPG